MKKLLLMLLGVLMALPAMAVDFQYTYQGQTLTYTIISEAKKNVKTKDGEVRYSTPGNFVSGYLILPEKVQYNGSEYTLTEIGSYAFFNCPGLTSVEIPNSVTSIGKNAFEYCSGLASVTIGNSVTSIGDNAFNECKKLIRSAYPSTISDPFKSGKAIQYPAETAIVEDGFVWGPDKSSIYFAPLNLEGEFKIPGSVTSIGNYAFQNCTGLRSVTIPNSVTTIGDYAFAYCSGLTSVEIPISVTTIGSSAFFYCSGLTSVTIPNSVTSIGNYAFSGCIGLTSVSIPNSVTSIGDGAFSSCSGLTSVTIPNSVTTIGNNAFSYCTSLSELIIEDGETEISFGATALSAAPIKLLYMGRNWSYATDNRAITTGLETVEIGDKVTALPAYAFYNCTGLASVSIPNPVTEIGDYAFADCSGLTSVTIPSSATSIGNNAFRYCSGLTKVEISDLAAWCRIAFVSFEANPLYYAKHLYMGGVEVTDLVIPETVTSIGNYAFLSCSGLTSVIIPNSVTSIGNSVFRYCNGLTSVIIPPSVSSIGNYTFSDCTGLIKSAYPSTKGNPFPAGIAIQYPAEGAIVEDGVVWGPDKSAIYFASLNLEGEFEIPNSVTSIGDEAFYNCSGLTSVTIPNSVTSIGSSAFENCTGLTMVEISDLAAWCRIPFDNYAANPLYYAEHLYMGGVEVTDLVIPETVTSIGNYAFPRCTGLTSVIIPPSVRSIGNYAFSYCSGLIKSAYPYTIANNPFSAGIAIKYPSEGAIVEDGFIWGPDKSVIYFATLDLAGEFEIPNSVTSIGESAFRGCSGLTSVTIPSSATSIGNNAFSNCTSLSELKIEDGETEISFGASALYAAPIKSLYMGRNWSYATANRAITTELETVEIGDKVTALPAYAFYNCTGLISVTIPNSVTSIGNEAFYNCSGLTSVTIPSSVTSIGNNAFQNCTDLTTIELESETPPNYYSALGTYKDTATLIIPDGTYNDYLNSDWQNFLSMKDMSGTELGFFNDQVFTYRYMSNSGEAVLVKGTNYSSMTSASIPDRIYVDEGEAQGFYKVTGIAANSFDGCTKLTQLKISANCTFIGNYAFNGCRGLTSVTIPNTITEIGNSAFSDCTGLTEVAMGNSVISIGESAFSGCTSLTNVEIPNSVTSIGNYAFNGCTSLASVDIPNSVTSIGNYAFNGCRGLTSVEIPNSVTSIGDNTFAGCTGLTSATIGNSVTLIGDNTFAGCTGLTSATIGNSVTLIGNNAFNGCTSLASVDIPNSVTTIGNYAFNGCTGLTKVEISDIAAWCNIEFGNAYANPLYYAKHLYLDGSEITELVIPNSVTSIGSYAFYNCSEIESITFEDGIDELSIRTYVFTGINPTSVYLGRGYNGNIPVPTNLTIGGFVTSLPENAYKGNKKLSIVSINNGLLQTIGASSFEGCSNLKEVTFPENFVEIGENAFAYTALTALTLPAGEIAANAFNGNNLTEVVFGSEVAVIGENAFNGSNALANVYSTPSTPPAAQNNSFSYYEGQLWVPAEAVDTYYNTAPCWYRFSGKPLVMPEELNVAGQTKLEGKPGETFQLTAELSPVNVTLDRILWHSTNPAVATVDNNGLVTVHDFDLSDASEDALMALADSETRSCQIIASTLYEDGPMAVVTIDMITSGIEYVSIDAQSGNATAGRPNDIYNIQGVLLKRNASQEDVDALAPGLYIIGGKKVLVK